MAAFGDHSENTPMFGGLFVLLAAWGLGGNLLLCALLFQNNLWTMMNRGLMAISFMGIFQSIFCLLPVGISGINEAWNFGDVWCSAYPFLFRYSQMSLMYMIVLLLVYNIISLKTDRPSDILVVSSFWVPIVIFIIPYIIFLVPAMMFMYRDGVTAIQEDKENLHACTVVVVSKDSPTFSSYRTFRAVEAVFGLLLPYLAVVALFGYLVTLISQRKVNKIIVNDLYDGKTSVDVLSERDVEGERTVTRAQSPTHTMESLAVRSDKQSEVVIYVLAVTFILFLAPYLYLTLLEVADPNYIKTGNGLGRILIHIISYLVALVNPTTVLFLSILNIIRFIKESFMKRKLNSNSSDVAV